MTAALAAALGALLCAGAAVAATEAIDDLGRRITLARPAQRIVALSPHATELVIAAGASDRLVGITAASDTPERLAAVPRIGGPGALDRERVLQLQPDLAVGWHSGNRAQDLDWLDRTGIALFRSEPTDLADIAATIRALGRLAGTKAVADPAADAFVLGLRTPCAKYPPRPAYVVVWERPPMAIGGRHWINDALRAAGFQNQFAAHDAGAFAIAPEAILAAAGGAQRISLMPGLTGRAAEIADLLSRPGPQLPRAVQLLCELRTAPWGER